VAVRKLTSDEKILIDQLDKYRKKLPTLLYAQKLELLAYLANELGDIKCANQRNKDIIDYLTPKKIRKIRVLDDQTKASKILEKAYIYLGRTYFHYFLIAMEWKREPSKRFYEPRMKVLKEVVWDLQDLADGKLDVYGLSMPPRTGKTTLGLLFTCWLGGMTPEEPILSIGYTSSLVRSFLSGSKEFISDEDYTFSEIFPESTICSTSAIDATLNLGKNSRYKTLSYRSIDGAVTGGTEAKRLLYLDDLVSGIEQALNIIRLDSLWMKVSADLIQRKKNGCPILIIGTRWSVHDPIGRIEEFYKDNPKAKFKKLSAIDSQGHSNFDYDFNVGFDDKHYTELKNIMDTVSWECIFMQNPIERDGLLYTDLKRYSELPQDAPDDVFAFTDVAFGGADYLCMPIAYQFGEDIYIHDVVFMKGGYKTTQPIVAGKIMEHKIKRALFEANNGGDFYSRDVMSLLKAKNCHCNIMSMRANNTQNKLSRIIQHAPAVKTFYFRDIDMYDKGSMYDEFMQAMLTFTEVGKNKHDDAPDACSGLASMCRRFNLQSLEFTDRSKIGW